MRPAEWMDHDERKDDAQDVRSKIRNGVYVNRTPSKVVKVPVDEETMTVRQANEHVERELERCRAQRRLHQEEDGRLCQLFQKDLEQEFGVSGHPKAERLFSLAWQEGHADGFEQVLCKYEEFVELIQP